MPLRAKIDESKLPKMAETNGTTPKQTGIKVIIVGAGTSAYTKGSLYYCV
jgi:phosphoribosylcarboxyaminoimidazole (NCAIR) mutase